ncbi:MAG: hypothetical protein DME19_00525 [Verrucomicrobia bacterium]|nr:MAG: hypothetical protein DME19_00525 [Verrucomicrobiota bacterium]
MYSLAIQPDGRILVGGLFGALAGQFRESIGSLNSDGTLDTTFSAGATGGYLPSYRGVYCVAVQPDSRILVGGYFDMLSGQSHTNLGRLNSDGSLDTSFTPEADNIVYSLAVLTDGKIVVGGVFDRLGGQPRARIGRLDVDTSIDAAFFPGVNGDVSSLVVQPDGKIVVGGGFTKLGGQERHGIGRLSNTDLTFQNLNFDGWRVTWLRGGASPEVWRTTLDASTNGVDWDDLGACQRIPGGWQLAGVKLASNATVRARGFVSGGGISSWFVETIGGPFTSPSRPRISISRGGSLPFVSVAGNVGP